MEIELNVLFLTLKSIITTVVATIILGIPALIFALIDRTGRIPYRIGQVWARVILRLNGVQIKVVGLDNIDKKNPMFSFPTT